MFQTEFETLEREALARLQPEDVENERTDDDDDESAISDHLHQRSWMARVSARSQLQDPLGGQGDEAARPDDPLRARRAASAPSTRRRRADLRDRGCAI